MLTGWSQSVDGGSYEIFQLDEARQNAKSVNKRSGKIAFFVARARYAVLSTDNKVSFQY